MEDGVAARLVLRRSTAFLAAAAVLLGAALVAIGAALLPLPPAGARALVLGVAVGTLLGAAALAGRVVRARRAAREQLEEQAAGSRQLFAQNPQPMWVQDAETTAFLDVNDAAVDRYGYARAELATMQAADLLAADAPRREGDSGFVRRAAPHGTVAQRHRLKSGREVEVDVTSSRLRFDGRDAVLVAVQDVTERNRLEDQLRYRAFHDSLTELANRSLFYDRVGHALALRNARGGSAAVVVLDLDGFKTINDSLGHTAGDQLLMAVAHRLKNRLRPGDTAARLGGDEFAVLFEDVTSDELVSVTERITASFEESFAIAGQQLRVTPSVGVALHRGTDGPEELLRDADTAMYLAKSQGKACVRVFEPSMHDAALERLELEADLRGAIERDELVIHYQPAVWLATGRVQGLEALVRWEHPERGLLLPAAFVPLAEETGMIVELGRWVLGKACRQAREWQRDFPRLGLAVNLSARQLRDERLVDDLAATLVGSGLDAATLTLEITESVMMEDPERAIETLRALRALGVRVALDDFGSGCSSLGHLRALPVDRLKIDKAFVDDVARDPESRGLVHAIVHLAGTLALETVAEGVEDADQATQLAALGSQMVQGFFYSRPLPAAAVPAFLAARAVRA